MEQNLNAPRGLDATTLKLVAIIAMLIDHIAWAFVPLPSILGQAMHIIGRITGPVMCFLVGEGYFHTRSVPRYAGRLLVFALISYVPFLLFEGGWPPGNFLTLNVMFTLLLGLLALHAWTALKSRTAAALAVAGCCLGAFAADWSFFGVLMVLGAGVHKGDRPRQLKWFAVVLGGMLAFVALPFVLALPWLSDPELAAMFESEGGYGAVFFAQCFFQLGVFLPLLLLRRYNGERGKGGQAVKWGFYVFYPAHLLLLGGLKLILAG